jgi:hypothetical protein
MHGEYQFGDGNRLAGWLVDENVGKEKDLPRHETEIQINRCRYLHGYSGMMQLFANKHLTEVLDVSRVGRIAYANQVLRSTPSRMRRGNRILDCMDRMRFGVGE